MNYEEALKKLRDYGQEHVLAYYEELTEAEKESLLSQIELTDFSVLASCKGDRQALQRGKISPLAAMQLPEIEAKREKFQTLGLEAIRKGRVGAVLLAGGMGTRLGSDDPKGMYNIGITREVYIFQRLIENLMDVVEQSGSWVPLYVMTRDTAQYHIRDVGILKGAYPSELLSVLNISFKFAVGLCTSAIETVNADIRINLNERFLTELKYELREPG